MRKRSFFVLSIVLAVLLLFCSCEDSSSRREAPGDVVVFNSNISVFMNSTEKTLTNTFKTEYFCRDAREFDRELAMLSLPVASPSDRDTAMSNIVAMGFDNIQYYWNTDEFPLLCSYIMGHRTVDEYDLIVVYLNFVNYDVEWSSNLVIGASGNHEGFDIGAQQVYMALKRYVNRYYSGNKLKLWLTGYSRGGGLSDALAFKILDDKEAGVRVLNVADKDMYAYSFEAPATVLKTATKYDCIHSILVDTDLIAALPPAIESTADYGLRHPGNVVSLNGDPDDLNNLLHKHISPDLSMPVFTKSTDIPNLDASFQNPVEFADFFIQKLVDPVPGQTEYDNHFKTRDSFHEKIEPRLAYLLQVLMRQKRAGLGGLTAFFSGKTREDLLVIFAKWIQEDGFYKDLYPILDERSVIYYDAQLREACKILPTIYSSVTSYYILNYIILPIGMDNIMLLKDNLLYIVYSHCPEVFYVLLKENRINPID